MTSSTKQAMWMFGLFVSMSMNSFLLLERSLEKRIERDDAPLNFPRPKPSRAFQPSPDFLVVAEKRGTDKVKGTVNLDSCLQNEKSCQFSAVNPQCRVAGHFYDSIYNRWLGPYATDQAESFQFLEIGYYNGRGFDAYTDFFSNTKGELHSAEISCLPPGNKDEGKWPAKWGNFAIKNKRYQELRDAGRLHCLDASNVASLEQLYRTIRRDNKAPPLKVVIDDASHLAQHMATTMHFWFPRLAPGGILVIEDIQPQSESNKFRTHILPQLSKDVHYCGDKFDDQVCFPTIQPLLKSIHCELHICVLERNDHPSIEADVPADVFDTNNCFAK